MDYPAKHIDSARIADAMLTEIAQNAAYQEFANDMAMARGLYYLSQDPLEADAVALGLARMQRKPFRARLYALMQQHDTPFLNDAQLRSAYQ